ncbi:YchF/TatD family DNA exonuclease [Utexia brackfieldae]|uniref:YchF/TatD family DNA exonuclease n=1 Tax=Utexia brackfieldae TaxID=3074108 RepID=UPI00370DC7D8
MILVDSHCHLDSLDYSKTDLATVMQAAQQNSVPYCLSVATSLSGYQKAKKQLVAYPNVFLSCGVHPLNLDDEPFDVDLFETLASDKCVIGLGETGLDYYYQKENAQLQQAAFTHHIRLGKKLHKPIIVHTREARADTLSMLKDEQAESGVLHCFTEDLDTAKALLDLGFYISISGIITFKNADSLREVARYVPIESLLIETDSPYLAPVPYRGKPNQPAYVREVAEYLAALKGISVEKLAQQTTHNFCQLFAQKLS